MKKIMLALTAFFLLSAPVMAGSATTAMFRQTEMSYDDCIKSIPVNKDKLYNVSQIIVLGRKKDQVTLRHTGRVGESTFVAAESEKIADKESLFGERMVGYIDGTLKNQSVLIKVTNVNGKALITVTMSAFVDHFFVSDAAVKAELDQYIRNTIWKIENPK